MNKKHCRGCEDDFYNHGGGGATECWLLENAKLITRYEIGTWTQPTQPFAFTKVKKPNCYKRTGCSYYNELPDFVNRKEVG